MTHRSRLLPLILVASCVHCVSAAEPQVIRIGVQLPITGERASVGRLVVYGLQMAMNVIKSREEKQRVEIELTFVDDKSTPEGAVEAMNDLVRDARMVAIIGEINSPFVIASAPIVNQKELPYLTAGSSPRTTAASPWIFRVGVSDALMTDLLTQYLVNDLHIKSYGILHDRTGIHNQRAELIASVLREKFGISTLVDAGWASGIAASRRS